MSSGSPSDLYPDWQRKLKLLTDSAWQDAKTNGAKIDQWLLNFSGQSDPVDVERHHAFHLLQQFIYFGKQEVYECLRVLFRDHFIYPAVQSFRKVTDDPAQIWLLVQKQLSLETRFLGVGYPAESGQSFLYHFRKANDLDVSLFPNVSDLIDESAPPNVEFSPQTVRHLVYLDDFCGTGQQVEDRLGELLSRVRKARSDLRVSYYLLFATTAGVENVEKTGLFDEIKAAIVFDEDYKAFGHDSLYYKNPPADISKANALALSRHYGSLLLPSDPLGYGGCELLVGFEHNTPDNTLPLFWASDETMPWYPIFPRANKH